MRNIRDWVVSDQDVEAFRAGAATHVTAAIAVDLEARSIAAVALTSAVGASDSRQNDFAHGTISFHQMVPIPKGKRALPIGSRCMRRNVSLTARHLRLVEEEADEWGLGFSEMLRRMIDAWPRHSDSPASDPSATSTPAGM